ncbi:hypothetical protein GMSM_30550 [Geomonas sp. Red276]
MIPWTTTRDSLLSSMDIKPSLAVTPHPHPVPPLEGEGTALTLFYTGRSVVSRARLSIYLR